MNSIILLGFFLYTMMYDITQLSIYLVTFLTSMIEPFISNAFQAAMTELFHKDRIQKVMGYTSAILSSTVILGPHPWRCAVRTAEFQPHHHDLSHRLHHFRRPRFPYGLHAPLHQRGECGK
ncbi:hypothetical protein [Salinicoccus roseus]|uniref:hypothetical protein n=1 Tax=Salinicoccus roseus TaxID=45670 RepID=UPI001EF43EE2|nr:hypothetical protein [Salinicoccus roseus]MCG7331950.1 hypothetical protein [Salinicoccus roseus]